MRSLKSLMEELGFNKEASYESQKAFVKHLIASAERVNPTKVQFSPPTQSIKSMTESIPETLQLEFDFSEDKRVS